MILRLIQLLIALFFHDPWVTYIWEEVPGGDTRVKLTEYLPDGGGPFDAIIVCPGGSYYWLDRDNEGVRVAEWLRSEGYAAYVLEYRTAGVAEFITAYRYIFRGTRHPDMISDLQRSIELVRRRSYIGRVGAMGFSAGGHLVMSSAEFHGTDFPSLSGAPSVHSLRPDFVAPVYPVVTLSDSRYVHERSRRGLLGRWGQWSESMRDSLSLERHIPRDCPPVFLLNCKDDPIVDWHNSVLLDSALTTAGIPHLYTMYPTGGHGFGAATEKQDSCTSQWQELFIRWVKEL